jgi:site-specific recombinase XerD
MLMMKAGLRVDEVCNLRLLDVVISDRKGTVTVAYGKGDKWRTVPLNNSTRKALAKYLATHESESPWLFVTQKANKMQPRTVQHIMAKYAKEIPGLTAHKLRHTFCHELVRAGVPLDQVAVLAGHMTANGRP